MERGKIPSTGRGGKSKAPQHPQDIFALGSKSTVPVSRDAEKRSIHKPSTSGVERKREPAGLGSQPPNKRARIGSPAESVGGTSLDVEPVDLVPNVLQALDTHNSDKLLGLLTGSIRLLKSQRAKPDPILCMGLLYLTKIRPNMFAHETVTNSLCTLLKREQGAAFKNKGNPLVFVLACNMLYAGHRDSNNWPDIFIKVYIEDALNERWWVECSWCKCLVENIVTAFGTKQPPSHLIPTDNTLGTMSPSGSGSPLMGSTEEDTDNSELEYSVFPRYSSTYEAVEGLVLEAIKDQIQRRSAAPDAIGKGFLKLLAATCGFPEIRMISASRLEAWLNSGKLWRVGQELLAYVCVNCDACGPTAARDHEVLAQLARMRLKTKPLQAAYQSCLREMVSESPALLRSVVTHTIYNELSNVRSPNNMAVLAALIQAQPTLVPAAMADTYLELLLRPEEYLRPLRALTREVVRGAREVGAAAALARALASPPPHEAPADRRERAFLALTDLICCCALLAGSGAAHARATGESRAALASLSGLQGAALGWLLETAVPCYRPARHDFLHALNKIMFVEPMETYSKVDNWPPESERALIYRVCCEAPLPQNNLLRVIFIGLAKEIPISPAEVFELVEQLVRRACALPAEDSPLQLDKLEIADYIFQLCQFNPPDNITLPQGYTPPPLAITSLYWRGWVILTMLAAHNPLQFAERAAATYPTLRALIETCITNRPSLEWNTSSSAEAERAEAERAAILQLETHLAAASNSKLPVTEHTSRLLSQLTTLEPLGPARKPPQSVIESLSALSQQLRLGKLLCRQPALLLSLVERHGTRRAMPWLHQLLRQDQLELSVLPVQCLCEFLSAGAGAGAGEGKAGELCLHLRRTLHDTEEGARALLHYYLTRLAHHHAHTRASASRGLKLVLQSEDATEMDYSADVSPQDWLDLLWELRHWNAVRTEAVARIRAACLVECVPGHVAAYIHFLAKFVREEPHRDHTDIVLDLSQVLMERTSVMAHVLGTGEHGRDPTAVHHQALHDLTHIFFVHLQKLFSEGPGEEPAVAWGVGERVSLLWPSGRRAVLHTIVAHAHLKLLCLGPSMYDSNQDMYTWLQQVWFGSDAPQAYLLDSSEEASLLPDWLRLHLVRSARPHLLDAGLRTLPAHKLALFIQTFGMPVPSMSALLKALDACPAGAVVRLGVERGYMAQLLRVQRTRGAHGGAAFASALRLQPPQYPPDDNLFAEEPLPEEMEDDWGASAAPRALALELVPPVLSTAFGSQRAYMGDLDTAICDLLSSITEEVSRLRTNVSAPCPYINCVISFLQLCAGTAGGALGLVRRPACAAAVLRALLPLRMQPLPEIASALLVQCKGLTGPVVSILGEMAERAADRSIVKRESDTPQVPPRASREQLIALLESATPSSLEAIGNKIIETQDSKLIVDVISHLLEKSQDGHYEIKVKSEEEEGPIHVLGSKGRGCGLLLDWVSALQHEAHPARQMRLMFRAGGAAWRPLLVTLLAHRASARTLHDCLAALLLPTGEWNPSAVLDFAETLIGSPRVWQGRDKSKPKHAANEDTLRLRYTQLDVLIRYVIREAKEASESGGMEAMRRRIESRLPLVLACCGSSASLLACALRAAEELPMLLLLLYIKVPKIRQLLQECEDRPPVASPMAAAVALRSAVAASTSATDAVSHTILTAIPHHQHHNKELSQKVWRMEAGIRSVWARVSGAGARALPLAAALLRGTKPLHAKHHQYLLSSIEALPDDELFADETSEDLESILECFLNMARVAGGGRDTALAHRVAALLRRYLACRPQRAAALLHAHQTIVQSIPALSALQTSDTSAPASAAPPPHALLALQRRNDTPENLHWLLQEVETWGTRRGGGWGGAACASAVLCCTAPLASSPYAPLRSTALSLLVKILPCVTDTKPGLQAILECLESNLPEVTQSALDALPELVCGMQEHAARLLMRVFELGVQSRHPVEPCLTKCVTTINMMRGC